MVRISSQWEGERRQAIMDLFSAHAERYLEDEKIFMYTPFEFITDICNASILLEGFHTCMCQFIYSMTEFSWQ